MEGDILNRNHRTLHDSNDIINDYTSTDEIENNASSSSQIAKLNAVECMKWLLLPLLPEELNQSKSDSPNLLHSTKKLANNNKIHIWSTNENGSINDDSTNFDIDSASSISFSTTNDTNLSVNG